MKNILKELYIVLLKPHSGTKVVKCNWDPVLQRTTIQIVMPDRRSMTKGTMMLYTYHLYPDGVFSRGIAEWVADGDKNG